MYEIHGILAQETINNFPQNRLTDHRINLSLYALDKIILGEMDELVADLVEHDKHRRLGNL